MQSSQEVNRPESDVQTDLRCVNGHLLGRLIMKLGRRVLSIKCHRCKHVTEEEIEEKATN